MAWLHHRKLTDESHALLRSQRLLASAHLGEQRFEVDRRPSRHPVDECFESVTFYSPLSTDLGSLQPPVFNIAIQQPLRAADDFGDVSKRIEFCWHKRAPSETETQVSCRS